MSVSGADPVNNPAHYQGPVETIDIIKHVTSSIEDPFVGSEVYGVGKRVGGVSAVDAVARAERLHAGGAGPERARDPVVRTSLLNPSLHVADELSQRDSLVDTHPLPPLWDPLGDHGFVNFPRIYQ